jgi:hypothetical protein
MYGIEIIIESEAVSKFPRSTTAKTVANAKKKTSIDMRVKRRNFPHPAAANYVASPVNRL